MGSARRVWWLVVSLPSYWFNFLARFTLRLARFDHQFRMERQRPRITSCSDMVYRKKIGQWQSAAMLLTARSGDSISDVPLLSDDAALSIIVNKAKRSRFMFLDLLDGVFFFWPHAVRANSRLYTGDYVWDRKWPPDGQRNSKQEKKGCWKKKDKKKIIFLLIRAREDIVSAAVEHPTLSLYKNKGSIIYQKKRNEMYWRAAGAFVSGWYASAHRSSIFRVSWCLSAASICVTSEILSLPPPLQGSAPPFCFMRSFVCWWISPSSVSFPPRTNASLNIKTFWGQSFSSFFFFGRFRFTRRPSRWRRTSQPFPRRNHRNLNDAERGKMRRFLVSCILRICGQPLAVAYSKEPRPKWIDFLHICHCYL